MVDYLLNGMLDWLSRSVLAAFDAIVGVINHILLVSPDVTVLPQVQALTAKTVGVVDVVFVVAFVAIGAITMLSGGNAHARYTAKDLLARAVVGFIAAHFSTLLCAQAITVANAVGAALTSGTLLGPDATVAMRAHLSSGSPAGGFLLIVIAALVVFLLAATAFQAIGRLGMLLVLTALAPVALACHALPYTDPIARLWWRAYVGCLVVPILQAFTLYAGEWMLTDTRHMFPELPVSGDPFVVANLLIVVVLLWTTVKIPGLMSRYVTTAGGRSSSTLAALVRVVVVGGVSRMAPGLGRAARVVVR